jgi:SAM-dependent methyltransferase
VSFAVQDARRLSYGDDYFDMVYPMSVVEHIEGPDGDREAMREMMRVLKPGGRLVVSVPYGSYYAEQYRVDLRSAATRMADTRSYCFQRIYDSSTLRERLLASASDLASIVTISRRHSGLTKRYSALSENARGLLGFLSPFVSRAVNRHCVGSFANEHRDYSGTFTSHDIYGDAIFSARKPFRGQIPTEADA